MPTTKPRLSLTLEEDQHDVLERLARLQGRSIGSVIRELIEAVLPGLERTVRLGEAYATATDGARAVLAGAIEAVEAEFGQDLDELEESSNELMGRLEAVLGTGDPRPSNNGGQVR